MGGPVRSVLAHPGYTSTNVQTNGPVGAVEVLLGYLLAPLAQAPDRGALPQLYAATGAEVWQAENSSGRTVLPCRAVRPSKCGSPRPPPTPTPLVPWGNGRND